MKQTFLTRMGSVNLESSRVQNMLITMYKILHEVVTPYTVSLITTRKTKNDVQPQRHPKIESTKSYYNLLWITIVQIRCSSSMERIA